MAHQFPYDAGMTPTDLRLNISEINRSYSRGRTRCGQAARRGLAAGCQQKEIS